LTVDRYPVYYPGNLLAVQKISTILKSNRVIVTSPASAICSSKTSLRRGIRNGDDPDKRSNVCSARGCQREIEFLPFSFGKCKRFSFSVIIRALRKFVLFKKEEVFETIQKGDF
jgi:hypothetical protein